MTIDANTMLEKFKDLDEKKNYKLEYERKQRESEIEHNFNSALDRLDDLLSDDSLFGLQKIYWFLDDNGTTYETGDGTEKRYFTEIQDSSLPSHENNIYFHPFNDKQNKANIKMCEYHDVDYRTEGNNYQTRAETVMQLEFDKDGNYKTRFNAYFKQWNETYHSWHTLINNENTKKIKTDMLNNFCDRLPEFMEEVEGVFNELMHDQEIQYGNEKQIKELKLNDFAKAYELYCEKFDWEDLSLKEIKEKGEVHLLELLEDNIIYEANYDVNDEKLKYYKRGELLGEEDYSLDEATNELLKGYDDGVESTHYYDGLYYHLNNNLKFIDTCDTFFLCEDEEYFWNEDKTRLFKCYAPLSENEKSLLLENADKENIFDDNGLVHIVYDSNEHDENVLFDIVKQYSERPDVMKTSSYEAMVNKLKQGMKM